MNPIENVWQIIKNRVYKKKPENKDDLIHIVKYEWKKIDKKILESLINSMPNRIQQVIENKGDSIMY